MLYSSYVFKLFTFNLLSVISIVTVTVVCLFVLIHLKNIINDSDFAEVGSNKVQALCYGASMDLQVSVLYLSIIFLTTYFYSLPLNTNI